MGIKIFLSGFFTQETENWLVWSKVLPTANMLATMSQTSKQPETLENNRWKEKLGKRSGSKRELVQNGKVSQGPMISVKVQFSHTASFMFLNCLSLAHPAPSLEACALQKMLRMSSMVFLDLYTSTSQFFSLLPTPLAPARGHQYTWI